MFTHGGQIDLLVFAAARGGGGKGGGGSPAAYVPPTYSDPVSGATFYDPNQLNDEITNRQAQEKATSDAAAAQAAADAATKEQTFQTGRQTSYNDALAAITQQFKEQGVDPTQYMSTDIVPTLTRQFNSIQDLDPNPAAAFPTSLGDTILGNIVSGKRTQATNAVNSAFAPNYSTTALPTSLIDTPVSDVVNQQFDPLLTELQNTQKRNLLTPQGFQGAMNAYNQKKAAATNTVQNLGQGILSTDRSSLDDLISGAKTAASGIGASDTFDPSVYTSQASDLTTRDVSGFTGALQNAVGGTKFASLQDLINAGGALQGSQQPSATEPGNAPAGTSPNFVPPDILAQQKRGLGNTGAF